MLLTGLSVVTIGLFKHGDQLLLVLVECVLEVVCVLVWLVVDMVLEGLAFLGNSVVVTLTMGLAFSTNWLPCADRHSAPIIVGTMVTVTAVMEA